MKLRMFLWKTASANIFILLLLIAAQAQVSQIDSLKSIDKKENAVEGQTQKVKKSKSPRGAVIRSLIFPGWGQWYNEKKLKALLAFGAECGAAGSAIYWNQKVVSGPEYYREYYINRRNESVWWLVGIILVSMADAYVDAHLYDFDESPDLSMNIGGIRSGFSNGENKFSFLVGLRINF